LLIEKTALDLACVAYEKGRSLGYTSKYKDAREYAKKYVEMYIPLAVNFLMDILANPATPESQKSLIYDAIMERTNDKELSNIGIDVFKNDIPYLPDNKPAIYDKRTIESMTTETALFQGQRKKLNG
jgi:hypothetical protein